MVSLNGTTLVEARHDVVPKRASGWDCWGRLVGMVGVVIEDGQARRSDNVVPTDHTGCDPVIS